MDEKKVLIAGLFIAAMMFLSWAITPTASLSGFSTFGVTRCEVYGDVNGDRDVDAVDVEHLGRAVQLHEPLFCGDLTGDGGIDSEDITALNDFLNQRAAHGPQRGRIGECTLGQILCIAGQEDKWGTNRAYVECEVTRNGLQWALTSHAKLCPMGEQCVARQYSGGDLVRISNSYHTCEPIYRG